MLKTLAWDTKVAHLAKPCEAQGAYTGMPLVVELSTAALVLMVAVVGGVVVFQIRDRLETLDTSLLDRQRGGDEAPP